MIRMTSQTFSESKPMKSQIMSWFTLFILIGTFANAEPPQSVIDAAKREGKLVNWGGVPAILTSASMRRDSINGTPLSSWKIGLAQQTRRESGSGRFLFEALFVDVTIGGSSGMMDDWIKAGVIRKWSVPSLAQIHKTAKDSQGYWAIPHAAVVVPGAYNTNLVSAKDAPKSYEDFLDPKRRGKFAITVKVSNYVSLAQPNHGGKKRSKRISADWPLTNLKLQRAALRWWPCWPRVGFPGSDFQCGSSYRKAPAAKRGSDRMGQGRSLVFAGAAAVMSARAAHPNAAHLWLDWL